MTLALEPRADQCFITDLSLLSHAFNHSHGGVGFTGCKSLKSLLMTVGVLKKKVPFSKRGERRNLAFCASPADSNASFRFFLFFLLPSWFRQLHFFLVLFKHKVNSVMSSEFCFALM